MTRRQFLQFVASSLLVVVGLGNLIALLDHTRKMADTPDNSQPASHGFGSRKFGV